jgi:hypothetical protein
MGEGQLWRLIGVVSFLDQVPELAERDAADRREAEVEVEAAEMKRAA